MNRREHIRAKLMERSHDEPPPVWLHPGLGPCRIWDGPDSGGGRGGGYPRMSLDGQTVAVHIVSWTNEHGYLPGKKQLDHLCRRRRCIAVKHLEPVTHRENQRRRARATQWSPREMRDILAQEPNAKPAAFNRLPKFTKQCEEVT